MLSFAETLGSIRRDMDRNGIDLVIAFRDGAHFIEKPNDVIAQLKVKRPRINLTRVNR
jgi:hypothetical protein